MILNRGAWRAAIDPPDEIPWEDFSFFLKHFTKIARVQYT